MELKIEYKNNHWYVYFDNKIADHLTYEEMIGLVASITMPRERKCLNWLEPIKK